MKVWLVEKREELGEYGWATTDIRVFEKSHDAVAFAHKQAAAAPDTIIYGYGARLEFSGVREIGNLTCRYVDTMYRFADSYIDSQEKSANVDWIDFSRERMENYRETGRAKWRVQEVEVYT